MARRIVAEAPSTDNGAHDAARAATGRDGPGAPGRCRRLLAAAEPEPDVAGQPAQRGRLAESAADRDAAPVRGDGAVGLSSCSRRRRWRAAGADAAGAGASAGWVVAPAPPPPFVQPTARTKAAAPSRASSDRDRFLVDRGARFMVVGTSPPERRFSPIMTRVNGPDRVRAPRLRRRPASRAVRVARGRPARAGRRGSAAGVGRRSGARPTSASTATAAGRGRIARRGRVELDGLTLELRPTAAGQVGLFPEHAACWPWLRDAIADRPEAERPPPLRGDRRDDPRPGAPRRPGHPRRRRASGRRLGAAQRRAVRAGGPADPLDRRRRARLHPARGPARPPVRRARPRPAVLRPRRRPASDGTSAARCPTSSTPWPPSRPTTRRSC